MLYWIAGGVLWASAAAGALAQTVVEDPYESLRAPALAAYEAGETARAYTLYEAVFRAIPDTDPGERASTAFSLAILARESGEPVTALDWLETGFTLHRDAGTPDAEIDAYIGYAGRTALEAGDPERAIAYLEHALRVRTDTDETREARAGALNTYATALYAAGRYEEASEQRRHALQIYTDVHGPDHAYVGFVLEALARDLEAQGNTRQALDAREEALVIALSTRESGDMTIMTLAGEQADALITLGDADGLRALGERVTATAVADMDYAGILSAIAHRAWAARLLDVAAELHQSAYEAAAAAPDTPDAVMAVLLLNRAISVQTTSGYAAALPALEDYADFIGRMDGASGLRTIAALERVWTAMFRSARFVDAEANARARIDALTARADDQPLLMARALNNLALALHEQLRPNEAEPVYEDALRLLDAGAGDEGLLVSLLDPFAIHLVYNSNRDRALEIARRNTALRAEVYGRESLEYGRGLKTLATVESVSGMADAALASLLEAEAVYDALGPSANEARVDVMIQRAEVLYHRGQLPQAETLLDAASALITEARDDQRRDWHSAMARLRKAQGQFTEALMHLNAELAILVARDGENARRNAYPLLDIAKILRLQGNLEDAEAVTRRVIAIHESYGFSSGNDLGVAWDELATNLSLQGRRDEALQASQRSADLVAEVWPRGTSVRALSDYNQGYLLMTLGQMADAERFMRQGIEDMRALEPRSDVSLGNMVSALGHVLEQRGQYTAAASAYREALDLRVHALEHHHPALASNRAFLGRILLERLDQPEESLALFRDASQGLIEGIVLRSGTAAENGADGIVFAQKDAFFIAHVEAIWANTDPD
ncbi:tetratricopeptide repeat protein [Maricaulaceae bacterium MS644]